MSWAQDMWDQAEREARTRIFIERFNSGEVNEMTWPLVYEALDLLYGITIADELKAYITLTYGDEVSSLAVQDLVSTIKGE